MKSEKFSDNGAGRVTTIITYYAENELPGELKQVLWACSYFSCQYGLVLSHPSTSCFFIQIVSITGLEPKKSICT
ncbi:MAG: hypothetical protein WBE34_09250, partial [Candidatus Nitrosopolaris sp.]